MRGLLAFPVLAIAACSQPSDTTNNEGVDINAAADAARNDIDAYAAANAENVAMPAPMPPASATEPLNPPGPGTPGGLPDDRTPVSEAPFAPDSAQGAANVAQTYYALIEGGKYRQAWNLWGHKGQDSGASEDAFAAGFARYAEYHANIGAPGRIDAGAGQRYVIVPVQVYGRLKETGKPVYMVGSVTLHRTGDIDGATPEQRNWHLHSVDVSPAPAKNAG